MYVKENIKHQILKIKIILINIKNLHLKMAINNKLIKFLILQSNKQILTSFFIN
jgi:hypothetical protein